MQAQHQAHPLICAQGNGAAFLAWIKEGGGFTNCLGKDPLTQPKLFSRVLEYPPQHSVLIHITRNLPSGNAKLVTYRSPIGPGRCLY